MIVLIEDPMSKTGLKDWNDPQNNENEKKVREKYYPKYTPGLGYNHLKSNGGTQSALRVFS